MYAFDACAGSICFRLFARVRLRQQAVRWNGHEVRIRKIRIPIRVRQLERFGDRVDVVGAVPLHPPDVERLEHVQRFEQHGALAVECLRVDLIAPVGRHRRLLDLCEELGEVARVPGRAVLFQEGDHLPRDVALVEAIASRHDARRTATLRRRALCVHHALQRVRQVWNS